MLLSFALGGYAVYGSVLGAREDITQMIQLPIFVFGTPLPLSLTIRLTDAFAGLWAIYIILFAVALNGPSRSLLGTFLEIRKRGFLPLYENSTLAIVVSFSSLMVIFLAIEFLQGMVGLPTGTIPDNPPLLSFILMSWAPIAEEIGFRVTLIGGVALVILLSQRIGLRSFKVLWHPSRALENLGLKRSDYSSVMYSAILISSLFFGVSHIAYTSTWEIGKLSTATIAGFVIGWMYFRMGFPTAVLLHWSFNFLSGAYVYFACALTSAVGQCEEAAQTSPLVNSLDVLVIMTGIAAIGMLVLNRMIHNDRDTGLE
jgi:membrane protease YdiL (CAAX protease family)